MQIKKRIGNENIFKSFMKLKGNTRTAVSCEPLWGIPYVLFNFYLSLYMKELGVTDKQLGYLISLGFVAGAVLSLVSGGITDKLGRKKTTLIFDFISWPLAVLIYLISNSFAMFALATFVNSFCRIVGNSWNLMVIEDADNEQRVAAFNMLNIINISTGVIIPLAGILVGACGLVKAERIFFIFAIISMSVMILLRNHFFTETAVGRHILEERRKKKEPFRLKNILPLSAFKVLNGKPKAIIAVIIYILFNIYLPLGTFNSLYFAPFMTEVLKLGKTSISLLGGVYSAVIFVIFVFVIPAISSLNNTRNMQSGFGIQVLSLLALILIPTGNMVTAILCIAVYAAGFGVARPFIDSMMAEVSEGEDRAGIYAVVNTITCAVTALIGFVSGSVYLFNPRLIYVASIAILVLNIILLAVYYRLKHAKC